MMRTFPTPAITHGKRQTANGKLLIFFLTLTLLAASGCRQALIGFESPRAEDLGGMDPADWKRRRAPRMLRTIDALQSRGVSVNGCFILGLDGHTSDVFPQVLDFVRRSGLAEVQYTAQELPQPRPNFFSQKKGR